MDVFKRAYKLSLEIHKSSLDFPKIEQFGGLADQIRRASRSVCANMVEGLERSSTTRDKKHFLRMAIGSVSEARLWCRYALDFKYIDKSTYEIWRNECEEIAKMLNGIIKKLA